MIQLGFWQTVILILKFWPHVVAFVSIVKEQSDIARVQEGLLLLRSHFNEINSVEDTANSSSGINSVFRN